MLVASYSPFLVVQSLFVAILASYVALDMAGRVNAAQGKAVRWWLIGGACAMGLGIWSMHFVGMLAFKLPIPLGYDPGITFVSLLIAIVSSAFGLWLGCHDELPWPRLAAGAVLMGLGISGMHYTGMAAMRMEPAIEFDPTFFALSIVIATSAAGAALWLGHFLRQHFPGVRVLRGCGAIVMGLAIVLMHYTGMHAARFPANSICKAAEQGLHTNWLALVIVIFTLAVLIIALIVSVLEVHYEERTSALAAMALYDNLTGLPNRVLLNDRIDQAIRHAEREQSHFTLMFIDLDGFKQINDTYGHHIGDQLLIGVARRIQSQLRTEDTVSRIGGDEFVLVARGTGTADAASIADKLVKMMGEPFLIGGRALRVSASIGIAMYPEGGRSQTDLLSHADAAMYQAKSHGRNTYQFFEEAANEEGRRGDMRRKEKPHFPAHKTERA
jgi:diguanylate cyclase (GGDEF)-like protein